MSVCLMAAGRNDCGVSLHLHQAIISPLIFMSTFGGRLQAEKSFITLPVDVRALENQTFSHC